jgi:hypothetical protein
MPSLRDSRSNDATGVPSIDGTLDVKTLQAKILRQRHDQYILDSAIKRGAALGKDHAVFKADTRPEPVLADLLDAAVLWADRREDAFADTHDPRRQGNIGLGEALLRRDKTETVLGAASTLTAANNPLRKTIGYAALAANAGQKGIKAGYKKRAMDAYAAGTATPDQFEFIHKQLQADKEQASRSKSMLANMVDIGLDSMPYIGEMVAGRRLADAATKKLAPGLAKILTNAPKIKKGVTLGTNLALKGTVLAAVTPHRTYEDYVRRQWQSRLESDNDGKLTLGNAAESEAESALRAFMGQAFERSSELMGGYLMRGAGAAVSKLPGGASAVNAAKSGAALFRKAVYNAWKTVDRTGSIETFGKQLLRRAARGNLFEEWTEERAASFLNALTGNEDFGSENPKNVLSRLWAAARRDLTPEQIITELGGFMLIPGGAAVLGYAADKVTGRPAMTDEQRNELKALNDAMEKRDMALMMGETPESESGEKLPAETVDLAFVIIGRRGRPAEELGDDQKLEIAERLGIPVDQVPGTRSELDQIRDLYNEGLMTDVELANYAERLIPPESGEDALGTDEDNADDIDNFMRGQNQPRSNAPTATDAVAFLDSNPGAAERLARLETPSRKQLTELLGTGHRWNRSERRAFARMVREKIEHRQNVLLSTAVSRRESAEARMATAAAFDALADEVFGLLEQSGALQDQQWRKDTAETRQKIDEALQQDDFETAGELTMELLKTARKTAGVTIGDVKRRINNMSVEELRQEAEQMGLDPTGNRSQLRRRVIQALRGQKRAQQAQERADEQYLQDEQRPQDDDSTAQRKRSAADVSMPVQNVPGRQETQAPEGVSGRENEVKVNPFINRQQSKRPERQWRAKTADIRKHTVAKGYWAVVDLGSLTGGDGLQQRDRNRQASAERIEEMYRTFFPEALGDSAMSDQGGIIINKRGEIIAGYGRRWLLSKVLSNSESAQFLAYMEWLEAFAAQKRIPSALLRSVEQPVLVRVVEDYDGDNVGDDKKFADESNRPVVQGMSETEQAWFDADVILENNLAKLLDVPVNGDMGAMQNAAFWRAFLRLTDAGAAMTTTDGTPVESFQRRMNRAALAALLKHSGAQRELVTFILENNEDPQIKRVAKGAVAAAPGLLRISKTHAKFDIIPLLGRAIKELVHARQSVNNGTAANEHAYFRQYGLFGADDTAAQRLTLALLESKAIEDVKNLLGTYTRSVESIDERTPMLFSQNEVPEETLIDILTGAISNAEREKQFRRQDGTDNSGRTTPVLDETGQSGDGTPSIKTNQTVEPEAAKPATRPADQANPYLTMPIERVRSDAEYGVKLAIAALAEREPKTTTQPPKPATEPEPQPETTPAAPELTAYRAWNPERKREALVVRLNRVVPRDVFDKLLAQAKANGGRYSKASSGGAVPGFQFDTIGDMQQFFQAVNPDADVKPTVDEFAKTAQRDYRARYSAAQITTGEGYARSIVDQSLERAETERDQFKAGNPTPWNDEQKAKRAALQERVNYWQQLDLALDREIDGRMQWELEQITAIIDGKELAVDTDAATGPEAEENPDGRAQAKEPWEMTKKKTNAPTEYAPTNLWRVVLDQVEADRLNSGAGAELAKRLNIERPTYKKGDTVDLYGFKGEAMHKRIIERALSEGKPVPAEVLADYPDLQKKAHPAAAALKISDLANISWDTIENFKEYDGIASNVGTTFRSAEYIAIDKDGSENRYIVKVARKVSEKEIISSKLENAKKTTKQLQETGARGNSISAMRKHEEMLRRSLDKEGQLRKSLKVASTENPQDVTTIENKGKTKNQIENDKQNLETKADSRPSGAWVKKLLPDENTYNRDKLSDFLEGVSEKYNGAVSWKWQDPLSKIGALSEADENGRQLIDYDKLKKAYQESIVAVPNPSQSSNPAADYPELQKPDGRAQAKEPWEMTLDSFLRTNADVQTLTRRGDELYSATQNGQDIGDQWRDNQDALRKAEDDAGILHKQSVQQAIAAGESVEAEVVSDYLGEPWADEYLSQHRTPDQGLANETFPKETITTQDIFVQARNTQNQRGNPVKSDQTIPANTPLTITGKIELADGGFLHSNIRYVATDKKGYTYRLFEEQYQQSTTQTEESQDTPAEKSGFLSNLSEEDQARGAELQKKLRRKLGGQATAGIDPEILTAGIELTSLYVKAGTRKFAAYAKAMINDLGEKVRPYLKSWYLGARNWPGNEEYRSDMNSEQQLDEMADDIVAAIAPESQAAEAETKTDSETLELESYTEDDVKRERAEAAEKARKEAQQKKIREMQRARIVDNTKGIQGNLLGEDQNLFDVAANNQSKANANASAAARQVPGVIEDFGEKIGGARKDTAGGRQVRRKGQTDEDKPTGWRARYVVQQIQNETRRNRATGEMEDSPRNGKWVLLDLRKKSHSYLSNEPLQISRKEFDTREEAEEILPVAAVAQNHSVYGASDGKFTIYRRLSNKRMVQAVPEMFDSREDAMKHMALHAGEILDARLSFGEEVLLKPTTVDRQGKVRRSGDATVEAFDETFGFRGVEFGNWVSKTEERQEVMNHAFDSFLDLAELLNVPPRAMSLDGELAIAFGARGHGLQGAAAHYERDYAVINLTKMSGAGHLAHEWWHAVDHYFARQDGIATSEKTANQRGDMTYDPKKSSMATEELRRGGASQVRPEVRDAFDNVVATMLSKAETYVEDTEKAEKWLGKARDRLDEELQGIRNNLATEQRYGKRFTAPATPEQLARFDELAQTLLNGESLDTEWMEDDAATKRRKNKYFAGRHTNKVLEEMSAIYKAVRGRTGFSESSDSTFIRLRGVMSRYQDRIETMEEGRKEVVKEKNVPTEFRRQAMAADQARTDKYWSSNPEMAARAFAAYVEDKLTTASAKNDFLVYKAHGTVFVPIYPEGLLKPYPEGEERQAINKAFDKLFDTIKTRETERGVMMYADLTPRQGGLDEQDISETVAREYAGRNTDAPSAQQRRQARQTWQKALAQAKQGDTEGNLARVRLDGRWASSAAFRGLDSIARRNGATAVPVTLPVAAQGGFAQGDSVFIADTPAAENYLVHEVGHVLAERGDRDVTRLIDAVDQNSPAFREVARGLFESRDIQRRYYRDAMNRLGLTDADIADTANQQRVIDAANRAVAEEIAMAYLSGRNDLGKAFADSATAERLQAKIVNRMMNATDNPRFADLAPRGRVEKIQIHTTRRYVTSNYQEDFDKAKAGNADAAARLIENTIKPDKIKKLASRHPNAIVCAVHAEEASGKNAIPQTFAEAIAQIGNLEVDREIVQASKVFHRGKGAAYRLANRPTFAGTVQQNREYIIVDDHVTAGGTLAALRQYIEQSGGIVVDACCLTASHGSTTLELTKNTMSKLLEKFDHVKLYQLIKEFKIGNSPSALSENEAWWLLRNRSVEAARDRLIAERQTTDSQRHERPLPASSIISTDPVTYDDAGNVIPLSERFNELSDDIRRQHVNHGTPHIWQPEPGFPHGRPRLDMIGTGEGNQSYGHGIYFAERDDVAKTYINANARKGYHQFEHDGATYSSMTNRSGKGAFYKNGNLIDKVEYDKAHAISGQSLYKLDIPDDVMPKLLDWDRNVSPENAAKIRRQAERENIDIKDLTIGSTSLYDLNDNEGLGYALGKGGTFYNNLSAVIAEHFNEKAGGDVFWPSDKEASEFLARAGIPGNTHGGVSQGATGAKYVIWDQSVLDRIALLERNGEKLDAIREAEIDRQHKITTMDQLRQEALEYGYADPDLTAQELISKIIESGGDPNVNYEKLERQQESDRARPRTDGFGEGGRNAVHSENGKAGRRHLETLQRLSGLSSGLQERTRQEIAGLTVDEAAAASPKWSEIRRRGEAVGAAVIPVHAPSNNWHGSHWDGFILVNTAAPRNANDATWEETFAHELFHMFVLDSEAPAVSMLDQIDITHPVAQAYRRFIESSDPGYFQNSDHLLAEEIAAELYAGFDTFADGKRTKTLRDTIRNPRIFNDALNTLLDMSAASDSGQADAEYLQAVESGDMETAQKMVDEAAKKAGYVIKAYHGTDKSGITTFETASTHTGFAHFSDSRKVAKRFAELWAKMSNGTPVVYEVFLRNDVQQKQGNDFNENFTEYMANDPSQVKSADPVTRDDQGNVIPLSERFNAASDDIRYSRTGRDMLGFFSPLADAVEGMEFNSIPADQLKARLLKAPSVKQEEIDDLGFFDWLDGVDGKVTKDQVLDFIANGGPRIEEVVKGERWGVWDSDGNLIRHATSEHEARAIADEIGGTISAPTTASPVKHAKWQMEGEKENYREVLIKLPVSADTAPRFTDWMRDKGYRIQDRQQHVAEYQREFPPADQTQFKSSHWSEDPNVLVHMRLNDRMDADGNRVLFVEEIQSDWHQAGRKQGYVPRKPFNALPIEYKVIEQSSPDGKNYAVMKDGEIYGLRSPIREQAIQSALDELNGKLHIGPDGIVPSAPFKKSWAMLAFKRVLRMAAEQGYDAVAWTPGEVQAERYDLSKQVKEIHAFMQKDGGYYVTAIGHNQAAFMQKVIPASKLDETVGKELAAKITAGENMDASYIPPPGENHVSRQTFSEDGLKVGGEGMKGFYDRILPNEVGKFVKKLDKTAGVEKARLEGDLPAGWAIVNTTTGEYFGDAVYDSERDVQIVNRQAGNPTASPNWEIRQVDESAGPEVWSVPITPAIRGEALRGLPMYQHRVPRTAEEAGEAFSRHVQQAANLLRATGSKWKAGLTRPGRQDLSGVDVVLRTLSHSADKVPALKRAHDHAIAYHDTRFQFENDIFNAPDATSRLAVIDDFRKQRPLQYKRLQEYLVKHDRNQTGGSVLENRDGTFTAYSVSKEKLGDFSSDTEAWNAVYLREGRDAQAAGFSEQAVAALYAIRSINDAVYGKLSMSMRQIASEYEDQTGEKFPPVAMKTKDGVAQVDLLAAIASMGQRRGYYMPRIRKPGRFVLSATKDGANPILEMFDTPPFMAARQATLEEQGYTVNTSKSQTPSEDVYSIAGPNIAMQDLINNTLERIHRNPNQYTLADFKIKDTFRETSADGQYDFVVAGTYGKGMQAIFMEQGGRFYDADDGHGKAWHFVGRPNIESDLVRALLEDQAVNPDTELMFAQALARQIANVVREHGSRSSMIMRGDETGENVWTGYEEDPQTAVTLLGKSTAGGLAKNTLARNMTRAITGTDVPYSEWAKQAENPTKEDYHKFVNERRIDSAQQPIAWKQGTDLLQYMLRNEDAMERLFGILRGVASVKYLASFSSPLVNLTALLTSVPGAMRGYAGISELQAFKLLGRTGAAYGKYMAAMKQGKEYTGAYASTIHDIVARGWHEAQYNREAVTALKGKLGRATAKAVDLSMLAFSVTEQINRVATIAATYEAIKSKHQGEWTDAAHEAAMEKAKKVSDRAHGVYGKANLPSWARHPLPRSFWMFKTFTHNYLQTMAELGLKEKQYGAALYMAFSPAVLGGLGASVVSGAVLALLKMVSGGDDPEEDFYKWLEAQFGEPASRFARQGVFSFANVNISGSLRISLRDVIPSTRMEFLGAPGGVMQDIYYGGKSILRGDTLKGAEQLLPRFAAAPVKAYREYTKGITTWSNSPVFYGDEPLRPTALDAIIRGLGFNPARLSAIRERQWNERQVAANYSNKRSDILARFRAYWLQPASSRDHAGLIDLYNQIDEYNIRVHARHPNGEIPLINRSTLKATLSKMARAPKHERLREIE